MASWWQWRSHESIAVGNRANEPIVVRFHSHSCSQFNRISSALQPFSFVLSKICLNYVCQGSGAPAPGRKCIKKEKSIPQRMRELCKQLNRSQRANTMCECVRARAGWCWCWLSLLCEYYYRSSVRRHGLMGIIETKTAEREFRLTVEMSDDFNELPKQWKIHPFESVEWFEYSRTGDTVPPHPFRM